MSISETTDKDLKSDLELFEEFSSKSTENELIDYLAGAIQSLEGVSPKTVYLLGGPAAGKSTLIGKLKEKFNSSAHICTDDYVLADRAYRFEHLDKQDPLKKYDTDLFSKIVQKIQNLQNGKTIKTPSYDEKTGVAASAGEENFSKEIGAVEVLFIDGPFLFLEKPDLLIYLHTPDEVRLKNRIARDLVNRSASQSDPEIVRKSFEQRQESEYLPHTLPHRKNADILITAKPEADQLVYTYSIFKK